MERKIIDDLEYVRSEGKGNNILEKFWVRDGSLKLVKLGSSETDQDLMEYLVSIILKKLGIAVVNVELCHENLSGKDGCLVTNFLEENEVLLDVIIPPIKYDIWNSISDESSKLSLGSTPDLVFQAIEKYYSQYSPDLMRQYIRVLLGKCLTNDLDGKVENIGLIKGDNYYRIPPSYDNGLSFYDYNQRTNHLTCVLIGYFDTYDVIAYIINNYYDYVADIIDNLEKFIENDLDMVDAFDIKEAKKDFIKSYMSRMLGYIKKLQNKKER